MPVTTAHVRGLKSAHIAKPSSKRCGVAANIPAAKAEQRQLAAKAHNTPSVSSQQVLQISTPLLALTAAVQVLAAGPAAAIDFQQPLALTVEWGRVVTPMKTPVEVINGLSATGPADIADAVNPANPNSPAADIANKVIEQVQPAVNTAEKVAETLGNPDTSEAPKPSDYFPTSPPELLSVGRDALVSRLQRDILPKIENQISELAKQDEPNEVTQTITAQLKAVRSDINKLAVDVKAGDSDAIQADASGLQNQFDALRKAIPRLNPKK